ncbi:MAG TPA: hypothetical protein VGK19_07915 [Capsulimonadaceae bacterium]|jgi:hypothetical protein
MDEINDQKAPVNSRAQLAWIVLFAAYMLFAFLYSVINPLNALPDEGANMQYVQFLADNHALPIWTPSGDSPGGYETQHPPVAFSIGAIAFASTKSLALNMRWQFTRWAYVLCGIILFFIVRKLAALLFSDEPWLQLAFGASVMLMPLNLMSFAYANPDGIAALVTAAGILVGAQIYAQKADNYWLNAAGGLVAGLGLLTKLSAAPVILLVLLAQACRPNVDRVARLRGVGVSLIVWAAVCGWYYVRSYVLYHSVFLHTPGKLGTGWEFAASAGLYKTVMISLRETCLSVWAQRGWFPPAADWTFMILIGVMILAAIIGYAIRAKSESSGTGLPAAKVALVYTFLVFAAQQVAFWKVDIEFNAGGRYLLVALPAIAYLLVSGVVRLPRSARVAVLSIWVLLLFAMNLTAANEIVSVLTPYYYPGWQMFEFGHPR